MQLPIIHLNGTSAADLREQACDCHSALNRAADALATNGPNARDYYPEPGAWERARAEHCARLQLLRDMAAEMLKLAEHADQNDRHKGR